MAIEIQGVENAYALSSIITKEALYRLKHRLIMPKLANQTFKHYFTENRGIGRTITVKRPFYAKTQKGRKLNKKQSMIDRTVTISVTERRHIGFEMSDEDATFTVQSFGDRYLQSGAEELGYDYDIEGGNALGYDFYKTNPDGVGVNDKTNQIKLDDFFYIRSHATHTAIPAGSRNWCIMNPSEIVPVTAELRMLDNPAIVGQAVKEAYRGSIAGWQVIESVHVPRYSVLKQNGAPLVAGTNQHGYSVNTDGWTASTKVLNKGTMITIQNVNEVQPRGDRRKTGNKQVFVVTADVESNNGGGAVIPVYPEINDGKTETMENVVSGVSYIPNTSVDNSAYQTVDALPADNAKITIVGGDKNTSASARVDLEYWQSIFFHGDALEYVSAGIALPKSASYSGRQTDPDTGVTISYNADFDINDLTETERLDILFGVKVIYPELGIRHIGQPVSGLYL